MHPTTISSSGLLVLRLVVGVTFLLHGLDKGFFAADGGIELGLLLAAASLALTLTGAGRFSADATPDLPRHLRAVGTRTRDWTRHSPRRERAHAGPKLTA